MTWFLILCGLFGLVMGLRGGSSQANTWEETDAEHYYVTASGDIVLLKPAPGRVTSRRALEEHQAAKEQRRTEQEAAARQRREQLKAATRR